MATGQFLNEQIPIDNDNIIPRYRTPDRTKSVTLHDHPRHIWLDVIFPVQDLLLYPSVLSKFFMVALTWHIYCFYLVAVREIQAQQKIRHLQISSIAPFAKACFPCSKRGTVAPGFGPGLIFYGIKKRLIKTHRPICSLVSKNCHAHQSIALEEWATSQPMMRCEYWV
jgi:hypothetical protein